MAQIGKGEHKALNVTQQGNHRIFVGLSWEATKTRTIGSLLKQVVSGKPSYHDLDLSCFLYDKDHEYIGVITGKSDHMLADVDSIYHSGDDQDGLSEGDDEQISVELNNLPANICHMIFKVAIHSGDDFSEIEIPEVRLVDAYSQHHFIQINMSENDGQNKAAYAFVELYRDPDNLEQWAVHLIDQHYDRASISGWKKRLVKLLTHRD